MKPFKWMFEEQNATEIEYKGKQVIIERIAFDEKPEEKK